jgi:hypothetical protein
MIFVMVDLGWDNIGVCGHGVMEAGACYRARLIVRGCGLP